MNRPLRPLAPITVAAIVVGLAACNPEPPVTAPPPMTPPPAVAPTPSASLAAPSAPSPNGGQLDRATFNRAAVRLNLPLYWASDTNKNGSVDPDELRTLLFYPNEARWTEGGKFTTAFEQAYTKMVQSISDPFGGMKLDPSELKRRQLVLEDLDQGSATLVYNDLRKLSEEEKTFVRHMLAASKLIDALFAKQSGIDSLASKLPADDLASQSMFRRNWGPKCIAPRTEKNPDCSAIPGAPKPIVDVWPTQMQSDPKFCEAIEKNPDAKAVMEPFDVVRGDGGKLSAVKFSEAYKPQMTAIAAELKAAAAGIKDPKEAPLKAYLESAARSYETNDWNGADEAWARMTAQNSKWYLRVAPDEVYWEPCSHKAGFHMTFALINTASLRWQEKLTPVQQAMEKALADLIGAPYKERKVTFHLPDFIDIVVNAGDDRDPMGATIGQSLPNWGPVVASGRGRTVAMSNLYTDPDSMRIRRSQADSLIARESLGVYVDDPTPGLLGTILHEATHNLGPAHEYRFKGQKDDKLFGGPLASTLEELKAQTGGLWYVDFLLKKGLISAELAKQSYADSFVWAMGHISRGMVTDSGQRKPYSQLAAIQVGFLLDEGAVSWDPKMKAANGTDDGAFVLHYDKMPAAIDKLMKIVGKLKATGDRKEAEALAKKYVDGDRVPHKVIVERMLRYPKASFVYSVDL
jgi:hypothetical protein